MKRVLILMASAAVLGGCSSAENLRATDHTDGALTASSGALNSERFVVTRPDGTRWSRTVEGNGDPMTVETTRDGLFSITGEGTVGGANIVFPGEGGDLPTLLQIVGQNDVHVVGGKVVLPNGATAEAAEFRLLASETRRARAESLDRYASIFANLTDAQKAAIEADRARFLGAVDAVSPVLADALRGLLGN